ncbi:MAG: Asp-tRNA(Asn)/Glu-tRNA(Gln) amidotransferase subunit GatC [Candidatus Nanohaloarchaea archaeon]
MVGKNTVEKVAENARLDLSKEEVKEFKEDFEKILENFSSLDKVDTEDVDPAFHPVDVETEAREDEIEETLDSDEVFQNTENEEEGYFKGPSA